MKTNEEIEAALDEIAEVCQKHGIVMLGVCEGESIYGEILVGSAEDVAALWQNAKPRMNHRPVFDDRPLEDGVASISGIGWRVEGDGSPKFNTEGTKTGRFTHTESNVTELPEPTTVVSEMFPPYLSLGGPGGIVIRLSGKPYERGGFWLAEYHCPAGLWEILVRREFTAHGLKFVARPPKSSPMFSSNGRELTVATREEYLNDNEGYVGKGAWTDEEE